MASESSDFASLAGRKAVVTGSSSGIGRAIAVEFARAGADVVVHCRSSIDAANETAALVREHGRKAEVVAADLGGLTEASCGEAVDQLWDSLGGVDVWVNNAGGEIKGVWGNKRCLTPFIPWTPVGDAKDIVTGVPEIVDGTMEVIKRGRQEAEREIELKIKQRKRRIDQISKPTGPPGKEGPLRAGSWRKNINF